MIKTENLSLYYDKTLILQDVSIEIPKGKITSIIGKNGSGKTTLLRAIARLTPFQKGKILIDSVDLSNYKTRELSKKLSFLPQNPTIPSLTVFSLVAHGRYPHLSFPRKLSKTDFAIIKQSMEIADVAHLSQRNLQTLSGGQRQKAYLAMVLCQCTDIVLLDEPSAFLDINQQFEVLKMARSLSDMGKTVIMVHHDLPQALKYTDHIILLDQGKAIFQGSPQSLANQNLIQDIFKVNAQFLQGNLILDIIQN